jgi:hypothetical protein
MRLPWTAAAAILALSALAAGAQDVSGFRSPSGNIHCQFYGGDDATIRCDLAQISNRPPPRPRDCDLEWGQAFEIGARAARGTRLCYGDTVQDARLPVLPYGQSFQRRGLACISTQAGVGCRNAAGHGFELSRAEQRIF